MDAVEKNRNNNRAYLFHNCRLGDKYIGADCTAMNPSLFEMAVVNLQGRKSASFTAGKKICPSFVVGGAIWYRTRLCACTIKMNEAFEMKRKTRSNDSGYINCGFKPGSIAEVRSM